jgi:hypothetical protein
MNFKPTFLYIKQHSVTGLLYFGKTVRKDPEKYMGSGIYWKNHIKNHGVDHVVTLWYCLFYEEQDCKDFAMAFSIQNNIIESNDWANLAIENGIGGTLGIKLNFSESHRENMKSSKEGFHWWRNIEKTKETHSKICPEGWVRGRIISPTGDKNPMYGRKSAFSGKNHKPETIEKMLATRKRNNSNKHSDIAKQNMSKVAKLAYANGRQAPASKKITVNGIEYKSMKEAHEKTGISMDNLRKYYLNK